MKDIFFQILIVSSLIYFGQSIAVANYENNQAKQEQELGTFQADRPSASSPVRL